MQQRLPSALNPPLVFAHRGARALCRENTIEAFLLALKLGANGLETDAWLTSDGQVVLDHDGVFGGRGRKRPLAKLDSVDRPPWMPTLTDFFEACGVEFDLSIDVKDPRAAEPIVNCALSHGFDLHRLWLCHDQLETVSSFRSFDFRMKLVESTRRKKISESLEIHAARMAELSVDVLNMPVSDWSGGSTTLVHRFGILAFGWDAQLSRQVSEGLRMGLDGIYGDYVDRLVEAYESEVGHQPRR